MRAADAFLAQAFGRLPLSIEVERSSETLIVFDSPIIRQMQRAAAVVDLDADRPGLPRSDVR